MPRDWDEFYAQAGSRDRAAEPLLVEAAETLPPGRALDVACGSGRNTLYLASLGWEVTAVDKSQVAIGALRQSAAGLRVEALAADLEAGEFPVPAETYDLVCDFYFLHRPLFPALRDGVRAGGVFAAAIHLVDDGAERPMNPAFLLRSGELRKEFAGWKILFYSEAAEQGHGRRAARIVARKA